MWTAIISYVCVYPISERVSVLLITSPLSRTLLPLPSKKLDKHPNGNLYPNLGFLSLFGTIAFFPKENTIWAILSSKNILSDLPITSVPFFLLIFFVNDSFKIDGPNLETGRTLNLKICLLLPLRSSKSMSKYHVRKSLSSVELQ